MKAAKMFSAIDTHTAGEAARLITGGIPKIPGKTMAEKKQYLMEHKDTLRQTLMFEPRGHNDMFGAFILEPTTAEADLGIIFMDTGGYLNMCGHNTIAAVTAAVETGMVEVNELDQKVSVTLDTPAGLVRATAYLDEPFHVKEVSFENVESFLYKRDQEVDVPGLGTIKVDISFGGSFFAILPSNIVGLKVEPSNVAEFAAFGVKIRQAINEQITIQHPTLTHIQTVDLVEFYDAPTNPMATYKNVVVFGNGQIDRSPCGTGTSAKIATLFAKNELKVDEPFVYESILGTLFIGRVKSESKVADIPAVIPEITGSAYITGFNSFLVDDKDPLKNGFVLK
ncbi:proline racemase [Listeria innocua]|uniref:proline racemase family protein n=1 Tax=Listeria innocua TaxID=1642 RepID=UPI00162691AC|nr:proline racemase family protein [Listeria innocua]MBC1353524.1 proline racemase [Listeria innocua]